MQNNNEVNTVADDTNYFLILVQAVVMVLIAPFLMIGLGTMIWMIVLSALLSLL